MPDAKTITIPAPVARPGERVEVLRMVRRGGWQVEEWLPGTILGAHYALREDHWYYDVRVREGSSEYELDGPIPSSTIRPLREEGA